MQNNYDMNSKGLNLENNLYYNNDGSDFEDCFLEIGRNTYSFTDWGNEDKINVLDPKNYKVSKPELIEFFTDYVGLDELYDHFGMYISYCQYPVIKSKTDLVKMKKVELLDMAFNYLAHVCDHREDYILDVVKDNFKPIYDIIEVYGCSQGDYFKVLAHSKGEKDSSMIKEMAYDYAFGSKIEGSLEINADSIDPWDIVDDVYNFSTREFETGLRKQLVFLDILSKSDLEDAMVFFMNSLEYVK